MDTSTTSGSKHYHALKRFLKSTSFSRAVLVGVGVTVPIVVGLMLDQFEIGLALCFGAFWSSPSDVSGSFRHKRLGIFFSAILIMVVSFIGGYLHFETWASLPVLGILSFGIAYLSIYGFRASLISFSGLLALTLSFAHDAETIEIYQYALLVGVGGLWYLLLAKVWYHLNPRAETEELLTEAFGLTAQFLNTRGKLLEPNQDRENLHAQLLNLQGALTINHASLREILILSRRSSGWSNYQDKRLLIFVQLVEMMETAIANPINYHRLDTLFTEHPEYLTLFQDLIFEMAEQLQLIADTRNDKKFMISNVELRQCFGNARAMINVPKDTLGSDEYLMLQNMLGYQEKQFKKLKRIQRLLGDTQSMDLDYIDRKTARRFVESQDYSLKILKRNFSFKSPIFRHSLRLALTIMVGYTLGALFPLQNPYWILLTIIVIMRPNYGLTKNRAKDRMIGTLIGGVIAAGMVLVIRDVYVSGAIGVLSLVIAFALIQKSAKASAIFITLSVVFIYTILSPDIYTVIKFRVVDTLIGAVLSYTAILWLWPTWELVSIKESIQKSIAANQVFFNEITAYYQVKGQLPTSYNLARKEAFLATSNLNSAFQRMAQEPKSKQNKMESHYELVVLNHHFLAALASLSTFIQHHKTSAASEAFLHASAKIVQNLETAQQCLNKVTCNYQEISGENHAFFDQQLAVFANMKSKHLATKDDETLGMLQETHLVWEQMHWLFSLSDNILQLTTTLK